MCKSKAQGGQRCYSHASKAANRAEEKYASLVEERETQVAEAMAAHGRREFDHWKVHKDRVDELSKQEARQWNVMHERMTELASTKRGQEELEARARELGVTGRGPGMVTRTTVQSWVRGGQILRARNALAAAGDKDARTHQAGYAVMKAGWMEDADRIRKAGGEAPDPPSWSEWTYEYGQREGARPANRAATRGLAAAQRHARYADPDEPDEFDEWEDEHDPGPDDAPPPPPDPLADVDRTPDTDTTGWEEEAALGARREDVFGPPASWSGGRESF